MVSMIATYSNIINKLINESTPTKTLRVLDESVIKFYNNTEWGSAYLDDDSVDWILRYYYGAFIADGVDIVNIDKLMDELKKRTYVFITTYGDALNRLYKETLVEFDPIENYDRKEESTHTYTPVGEEYRERNNLGDDTINHTQTAYNNNTIDSDKTLYNSSVTEKTGYSEGRKDTTATTSRIHGNIGVTTAPQMLKEYDNYYVNQSFWLKFWKMYLSLFCKGVFE